MIKQTKEDDRIWYSESRTINLGSYNSIKIESGYAVSLLPGETPAGAQKRASLPVIKAMSMREKKIRRRMR